MYRGSSIISILLFDVLADFVGPGHANPEHARYGASFGRLEAHCDFVFAFQLDWPSVTDLQ